MQPRQPTISGKARRVLHVARGRSRSGLQLPLEFVITSKSVPFGCCKRPLYLPSVRRYPSSTSISTSWEERRVNAIEVRDGTFDEHRRVPARSASLACRWCFFHAVVLQSATYSRPETGLRAVRCRGPGRRSATTLKVIASALGSARRSCLTRHDRAGVLSVPLTPSFDRPPQNRHAGGQGRTGWTKEQCETICHPIAKSKSARTSGLPLTGDA